MVLGALSEGHFLSALAVQFAWFLLNKHAYVSGRHKKSSLAFMHSFIIAVTHSLLLSLLPGITHT